MGCLKDGERKLCAFKWLTWTATILIVLAIGLLLAFPDLTQQIHTGDNSVAINTVLNDLAFALIPTITAAGFSGLLHQDAKKKKKNKPYEEQLLENERLRESSKSYSSYQSNFGLSEPEPEQWVVSNFWTIRYITGCIALLVAACMLACCLPGMASFNNSGVNFINWPSMEMFWAFVSVGGVGSFLFITTICCDSLKQVPIGDDDSSQRTQSPWSTPSGFGGLDGGGPLGTSNLTNVDNVNGSLKQGVVNTRKRSDSTAVGFPGFGNIKTTSGGGNIVSKRGVSGYRTEDHLGIDDTKTTVEGSLSFDLEGFDVPPAIQEESGSEDSKQSKPAQDAESITSTVDPVEGPQSIPDTETAQERAEQDLPMSTTDLSTNNDAAAKKAAEALGLEQVWKDSATNVSPKSLERTPPGSRSGSRRSSTGSIIRPPSRGSVGENVIAGSENARSLSSHNQVRRRLLRAAMAM